MFRIFCRPVRSCVCSPIFNSPARQHHRTCAGFAKYSNKYGSRNECRNTATQPHEYTAADRRVFGVVWIFHAKHFDEFSTTLSLIDVKLFRSGVVPMTDAKTASRWNVMVVDENASEKTRLFAYEPVGSDQTNGTHVMSVTRGVRFSTGALWSERFRVVRSRCHRWWPSRFWTYFALTILETVQCDQ